MTTAFEFGKTRDMFKASRVYFFVLVLLANRALLAQEKVGDTTGSSTTAILPKTSGSREASPTPSPSVSLYIAPAPVPTHHDGPKAAAEKEKKTSVLHCSENHLRQRDCLLSIGQYHVQFWHDKIFISDGIHRSTESIPNQIEKVEWHSLIVRPLLKRYFFEFTFWSPPDATTGISTLSWYIYEIKNGTFERVAENAIQKRVKVKSGQWRYDLMVSHELVLQGKKIIIRHGREHAEL